MLRCYHLNGHWKVETSLSKSISYLVWFARYIHYTKTLLYMPTRHKHTHINFISTVRPMANMNSIWTDKWKQQKTITNSFILSSVNDYSLISHWLLPQVIMNFNWKAINHQPLLPNLARWDHSRSGRGFAQQ